MNDSSANIKDALAGFLLANPGFETTRILDELRADGYHRLDERGQVYLDYTGGGLYADSQIRQHMALLRDGVFGNPHSTNPTSQVTTQLVEQTRAYVLRYFNASPEEYLVIFTANATGALKLVGESYPFAPESHYLMTFDNHNSVNGIREFARSKKATVVYLPVVPPDLRVNSDRLVEYLDLAQPGVPNLFAYPPQSNFSGVQHPLEWIDQAHARGWDVLADCAAFVPTNRLDLSRWHPDFVPISFYKMFGYPTGVGCLLARRAALAKLRRPWFAGGTISVASVQADAYQLAEGPAGFEDGTLNYLSLPAIEIGLKHIESIGVTTIHQRVRSLTGWLLENLIALRHANGRPLVRVYGPTDLFLRGGTIALNFYDSDGELVDYRRVEPLAMREKISFRTGCFCNPGADEAAHGLGREEIEEAFRDSARMTFEHFLSVIKHAGGETPGAIRISVGLATNFADVFRFLNFASGLADNAVK